MAENLFNKVWNRHTVTTLDSGQTQLFIGLHLIHEVTSPQAFQALEERGYKVKFPERTFATVDHIVPTKDQVRPFSDTLAEVMMQTLEENTKKYGVRFFDLSTDYQGIVHIIGPELGLTQPGMTIVCGDSHTSTHGAFGSIGLGIGTSQIRDVLATQTLTMNKPLVRQIKIDGPLSRGVYSKDIILYIMYKLGVKGGIGYAYEYAGSTIESLDMEARMSICNMSIEGGARCGYVNPDQTTFDYIKGRKFAPQGAAYDKAVEYWKSIASDPDATYDDVVEIDATKLEPRITWGITPEQGIGITEKMPTIESFPGSDQASIKLAYKHMGFKPGDPILGQKVDVAFLGSCTNGRITDLREAAKIVEGKKVAPGVKAFVVPGSKQVHKQAVSEGLDKIFTKAGFDWRGAGCSMCLAMNPDKLVGRELCASSSNRNFIGRQGSTTGRTLLMSPAMVVSAALEGKVVDVREKL